MKMFHRFANFLAMAVVACAALFTVTRDTIVDAARHAVATVKKVFSHGLQLADQTPAVREPSVRLLQAKEFAGRLMKRERPLITTSWRMCPST